MMNKKKDVKWMCAKLKANCCTLVRIEDDQ